MNDYEWQDDLPEPGWYPTEKTPFPFSILDSIQDELDAQGARTWDTYSSLEQAFMVVCVPLAIVAILIVGIYS